MCTVLHMHTHTHTHLTALFLELPRWAGTRKAKPIWILLKQETVSGSGISWNISLHFAPDRQPCQHPTTQFFTGRMPFLLPNQQRQSTSSYACKLNVMSNIEFKCDKIFYAKELLHFMCSSREPRRNTDKPRIHSSKFTKLSPSLSNALNT